MELCTPLRQSQNPQSFAFHPAINLCQNFESDAASFVLAETAPDVGKWNQNPTLAVMPTEVSVCLQRGASTKPDEPLLGPAHYPSYLSNSFPCVSWAHVKTKDASSLLLNNCEC